MDTLELHMPGCTADEIAGVRSEMDALDALYSGRSDTYEDLTRRHGRSISERLAGVFAKAHDTTLGAIDSELFWCGPLDGNGLPTRVHIGSLLSVLGY